MRYLSVCSGIEAATSAWHHMGWEPVAFSEIEPFPSAVLKHHYPNVPNWGDMTKYQTWPDAAIDVLVGGTPCQSFSIAGLRQGLKDPRGNLMLTFLGIAQRYRPRYIVWENVPGVLSSNGGRDFGTFLAALGELGYGWAYRVLDAQWFGVAQRRRRVFVVGCLGDQRRAAQVLFECESVRRDTPPSRAKGQGAAADAQASVGGSSAHAFAQSDVAGALTANMVGCAGTPGYNETEHILPVPHAQGSVGGGSLSVMASGQANAEILEDQCPTLNCNHEQPIMIGSALSSPLSSEKMASAQNVEKRMENANALDHTQRQMTENHTSSKKLMESSMLVPNAFKVRGGCEGGGKGYLGSDDTAFTVATQQDQQIATYPINGMCINKELRDKQMTGIGDEGDSMFTMRSDGTQHAVAFTVSTHQDQQIAQPVAFRWQNEDAGIVEDSCAASLRAKGTTTDERSVGAYAIGANDNVTAAATTAMQVRRLTPEECEALQGFPRSYTNIPWRGKAEAPDGPRYKALGNSMAVPVMRWIGERINA